MKIRPSRKIAGRASVALSVASALGAAFICNAAQAQGYDPVVFSFATVGDNRQDPKKADPTTLLANLTPTATGGSANYSGVVLPQDQEYMQNSAAWLQIQQGITAQGAQLLFFNGDMIYGYGRPVMPAEWTGNPVTWKTPIAPSANETVYPDAFFEYIQYAYFRGTVSSLFANGTYVLPVAGNHETQCSSTASPYSSSSPNPNCSTTINGGKQAYADNENAFRANMGDLEQDLQKNLRFSNVSGVFASNVTGLTAATSPGAGSTVCTSPLGTSNQNACTYTAGTPANNGPITGTQQGLDYSFDVQLPGTNLLLHFAVINTDPSGADATAPSDWLAGDFAAAAARGQNAPSPLTVKYFVFGHKAAYSYNYLANVAGSSVAIGGTPGAGGLDANASTSPNYRDLFWHVIAQYNATYFCGHEHVPNVQKYGDPLQTTANTPYQVIIGSGGSPFDDTMSGSSPNYSEPSEAAATDRYYAWALVQVHQSGAVTLNLSGFPDTGIGGSVYDLQNYDVPGAVFGGNLQ